MILDGLTIVGIVTMIGVVGVHSRLIASYSPAFPGLPCSLHGYTPRTKACV
jgi:hypothetical protein